jgi:leader peptidase (prepilin peptidase)/N-methyltransferase
MFGLVATMLLFVDLELHRLPDRLTVPSYPAGMILLALATLGPASSGDFLRAVAGSAAAFAGFVLLYLIAGAGLGAGDVKYAGVLGLHLAWLGWPVLIAGIFAGFALGAIVAGALLVLRRASLKTRIPLGPPLIIGAVLAIALGAA